MVDLWKSPRQEYIQKLMDDIKNKKHDIRKPKIWINIISNMIFYTLLFLIAYEWYRIKFMSYNAVPEFIFYILICGVFLIRIIPVVLLVRYSERKLSKEERRCRAKAESHLAIYMGVLYTSIILCTSWALVVIENYREHINWDSGFIIFFGVLIVCTVIWFVLVSAYLIRDKRKKPKKPEEKPKQSSKDKSSIELTETLESDK